MLEHVLLGALTIIAVVNVIAYIRLQRTLKELSSMSYSAMHISSINRADLVYVHKKLGIDESLPLKAAKQTQDISLQHDEDEEIKE